MGKIFKRTLATIMVVLMVLTCAPLSGFVGMDWDWLDFTADAESKSEFKYNDHTYRIYDISYDWKQAKEYCELQGGHLVTITSQEEQKFVVDMLSTSNRNMYWIGGKKDEKWVWITKETFDFTKWGHDEPNNQEGEEAYLQIYAKNFRKKSIGDWNDAAVDGAEYSDVFYSLKNTGFICEWEGNNKYTKEVTINVYSNDSYDGANKLPLVNVGTQLKDFTVTTASGSKQVKNSSSIKLDINEAKQGGVKLSKGYYQDYIIPADVFNNIFNEGFSGNLSVKMSALPTHNAGYISTAFVKQDSDNSSYKDAVTESIEITKGNKYKIILSAAGTGSGVKYYISQDDVHKVSSSTGIFEGDLFSQFVPNKEIYAYATSSKGTTALTKLKLKLVSDAKNKALDDFLKSSSSNILGDAPTSVVGQTGNLFLEGASFDLSAFKVPLSVGIDGNTIKVAIGIDGLVTYSHETKDNSTTGTKWKKDGEWSNFVKDYKEYFGKYKNLSDFNNNAVEDAKEKAKKANEEAKALSKKYGKNYSVKKKSKDFSVDVIGYGVWEVVWKGDEASLVFKEGSAILTGALSYEYCQNGFVGPCPGYIYFGFGGSLSAALKNSRDVADASVPMQWEFTLSLEPEVTAGAGVGWKNWASLGLYGKASAPITLRPALVNKTGNLKIDIKGEIGVEATALFVFKTKKPLLDGSLTVINKNWSKTNKLNTSCYAPYNYFVQEQFETTKMAQEVESTDRSYASETSEWLGSKPMVDSEASPRVKALNLSGMKFTTLQENVFYSPQTQVALVGEKVLMTYVEDDASRSANNRMRLMYTLYDSATDFWSQPLPVSDDGKNDAYPYLISDGENAYISWIKSNTLYPDDLSSTVDVYKACEVYFAKFDAENEAFTDVTRVTNDYVYDYNPSVAIDENGNPVVYYASCVDNDTYGKNNTITKYDGTKTVLETGKYYILSMTANSGATELTYIMDKNGDTGDSTGVNAYTISDGTTTETDHEAAIADVFYANLNGEEKLFFSDRTNIWYNEDGEKTAALAENTGISSSIHPVETDDGLTFIFTKNDGNISELYAVSQTAEGWTAPVQISSQEKLIENVAVASDANKLYGCITTKENNEVDLVGFSFVNFTDISLGDIYISELGTNAGESNKFTVSVFNNGTNRVDSLEFTVSDTLGTSGTQTVEVNIEPGDIKQVELNYPAPENYSETILTVSADVPNDKNPEDNTVIKKIGLPEISLEEPVVEENAEYYVITTYAENVSDIPATNVSISVKNNETNLVNPIEYAELILLEKEEISVIIPKSSLTYDVEGYAKVVFTAECEEISESPADEVVAILTNNSENESGECTHVETEMKDVPATCISEGKIETVCVTCGEVLGSITVSEKTGEHVYTESVTPATTKSNGKIESKCTCGDIEKSESIAKIESVTLSKTKYIYDGKNKTPKLTVKDANGNVLTKNVDYKITVASKRAGIGRYTVKVTFMGNYSGTKNLYFYILPGKPATVKSASQGTTSNKLTWSEVPGAVGYTLYYYSNSKKAYKKINTTTNTTYTVKGLLTGTKYTFKIVAYGETTSGKVYDSETYALLKSATKTKTPELTKVTASSTKGKAYVYHTDVAGETGYTVYYSSSSTTGFKKYANFKADTTRCDITKLTSGKTYYFKVRTYIKTDSGYVYSPWSAVKGVKVK